MPIEIRELIIRAYIEPSSQENITGTGVSDGGSNIQSETIDEILDLIKNKNER